MNKKKPTIDELDARVHELDLKLIEGTRVHPGMPYALEFVHAFMERQAHPDSTPMTASLVVDPMSHDKTVLMFSRSETSNLVVWLKELMDLRVKVGAT